MRKFNLRYLWTAAAAAVLTAAAIAIPAWGDSSGGSPGTQAQSSGAPLPPPPGGAGFSLRASAPSAAEIKRSRAKLDEFASCLKDHGIDAPTPGSSGQPPRPPSRSEMQQVTNDCGTPPAPPAGLPPLNKKQTEEARKAMAKGDCPLPPAPPARSGK